MADYFNPEQDFIPNPQLLKEKTYPDCFLIGDPRNINTTRVRSEMNRDIYQGIYEYRPDVPKHTIGRVKYENPFLDVQFPDTWDNEIIARAIGGGWGAPTRLKQEIVQSQSRNYRCCGVIDIEEFENSGSKYGLSYMESTLMDGILSHIMKKVSLNFFKFMVELTGLRNKKTAEGAINVLIDGVNMFNNVDFNNEYIFDSTHTTAAPIVSPMNLMDIISRYQWNAVNDGQLSINDSTNFNYFVPYSTLKSIRMRPYSETGVYPYQSFQGYIKHVRDATNGRINVVVLPDEYYTDERVKALTIDSTKNTIKAFLVPRDYLVVSSIVNTPYMYPQRLPDGVTQEMLNQFDGMHSGLPVPMGICTRKYYDDNIGAFQSGQVGYKVEWGMELIPQTDPRRIIAINIATEIEKDEDKG